MLWMTAEAVTLNGVPAGAEAGLDTETLDTLMSDVVSMFTVLGELPAESFPEVGSLR